MTHKDIKDLEMRGYAFKVGELCDDTINRMEAMTKIMMHTASLASLVRTVEVVQILMDMPSATQKSGIWVEDEFCSVCGGSMLANHPSDMGDYVASKYCPHCGARMESGGAE